MSTVAIHPPKTPVTKSSSAIAAATLPNVCKMPGPPAPFVPAPLPNIARSGTSPEGYSTTVTLEGSPVAISGASFKSMGDTASKGTGGGLMSLNCEGQAKFISPGSLTVKIQGKSVHLLSDVMSNNNGPSGSPPNAATMMGATQGMVMLSAGEIEDALCQACCDHENSAQAGNHRRSSNDLEKQCQADPKLHQLAFRTSFTNPPHPSGGSWLTKKTKPDAIMNDMSQCYDFKLCGDRTRGDQVKRQSELAGGSPPIIISCEECVTCNPSCSCN